MLNDTSSSRPDPDNNDSAVLHVSIYGGTSTTKASGDSADGPRRAAAAAARGLLLYAYADVVKRVRAVVQIISRTRSGGRCRICHGAECREF